MTPKGQFDIVLMAQEGSKKVLDEDYFVSKTKYEISFYIPGCRIINTSLSDVAATPSVLVENVA
ncbi:MAG: hypothetical protein ACI8RD_002672 [Bacillariaceae sp.]|jgi:hypothetical protein